MAKVISQLPSGGSVPKHNNLLGLNEGDYLHLTQFEKAKLDGIQSGAEVNVNADWNAISGDAQILNKPASFPPSTHTHTKSQITDFAHTHPISDVTGLPTALDALQLNKEDKTNKQNSLDTDATGTKYPTVTAVKNAIDSIYQPDTVIRYTAPTRVGNTFTFPSGGYDVLLSKQFHTNTSELETTIAAATDGFKRIDLVYFKSDNTIAKIQGTESATVAVRPEVPAGGIELCLINVFGATIEVPEVNGAYVQKSERANVVLTGSGVINQLNLVDEKATIVFKDAITRLNTISYSSVPYNGKRITLFNAQATPVTIGHSVSGFGVAFIFPDAQDYVLVPNQTIEFSFDTTYAPYAHHMLIGSKTDISGKKNKTLAVTTVPGITKTLADTDECIVFTNANPVAFTIPTNASAPIPIGTEVQYTQQGNGAVTIGGTGITFVTNISLDSVNGETRILVKIDTDTWKLQGTEVSLTKAQTFSQGLKTFLNGMFGMRNVANTFTSFFLNSTTQSRTWTFPDKNGTVAMTSDIIAQLNGTVNRLVKFGTATTGANSRIEDTGTYVGIGTVYSPKKDLTLGNQANREIGIEDSSSSAVGKALIMRAGRTINYALGENFNSLVQPTRDYSGMASDSSNNIYVCVSPDIYKQTNSTGNFVSMSVNIPDLNAIAFHPNGNVYACCDNGQVRMQNAGIGAFNLLQTITNYLWGITVAPNGDVYVCSQNNDIWKQTGGSGLFVSLGQTSRSWRGISAAPNGDIYACVNGGDIYKQVGGIGNFLPLGQVSRTWWKVVAAPNGNIYACVNGGDIYVQTNGIGDFVALGQQNRGWYGIVANNFNDVYASVFGEDIYKQINYSLGLPDLDGGANKVIAGTGKGTGKSRVEFYTGQKTVSGTDMQVETLREYIDENGYHVYTSMPVYADNAAAIAGGLPVGCEYRTATGVKMIVY